MTYRKKIALIGTGAATALAIAVIATPGLANHITGFSPQAISLGVFGPLDVKAEKNDKWKFSIKSHGQTDLRVTRVRWGPGASSNWHSHPGPNLLTVVAGSVREWEGSDPLCSATVYNVGDTFGDNGGSAIHLVRNNSTTADAEVIAVAFYPHATGTPPVPAPTTPQNRPTNCAAVGAPAN